MLKLQPSSLSSPKESSHHIQVAIPMALNMTFTYESSVPLQPGTFVEVPFRRTTTIGIVWHSNPTSSLKNPPFKLKNITQIYNIPPLFPSFIKFIDWVSGYTLAPLGNVLKLFLCVHFTEKHLIQILPEAPIPNIQNLILSKPQQKAWSSLNKLISHKKFQPILLQGVTGSGKTEVYFKAIENVLKKERTCLILQPEINLTFDWINRFKRHFGFEPSIWHSNLTPKKRRDTWLQILRGEIKVVVGTRSALFLPFPSLDMILVDEEHDTSYKQEEQTLYHARDMAVVRAKYENCPIILVSATPSLETQVNVKKERYKAIYITERYGKSSMPAIHLIDMREAASNLRKLQREHKRTFYLASATQEEIKKNLEKKQQTLIFLNRRGYAPLTLCLSCGKRLECPNCTAWLIEHRAKSSLSCHHCGYTRVYPKKCPSCKEDDTLSPFGPGVERLEEEISFLFPKARIALMTSDTLSNQKDAIQKFKNILDRKVDIIIGTQVMAKGHTFPHLTLTIVTDADLGLSTTDMRASEKTFQLLQQVGGRAGRADEPGQVILQTFDPNHPVMKALQSYDDAAFYALEQEKREQANLPPFGHLASIIISSSKEEEARQTCQHLFSCIPPHNKNVQVLGPAPASMAKRKRQYRWRFLIQAPKGFFLQNFLRRWVSKIKHPSSTKISIDIDPQSFM